MISASDVLRHVSTNNHANWPTLYGSCMKAARTLGDAPQGNLPHYIAADLASAAIARAKQTNPGCTPDQAVRIALDV